jgi:hypothetical protein
MRKLLDTIFIPQIESRARGEDYYITTEQRHASQANARQNLFRVSNFLSQCCCCHNAANTIENYRKESFEPAVMLALIT